jgi:hypothetical protein
LNLPIEGGENASCGPLSRIPVILTEARAIQGSLDENNKQPKTFLRTVTASDPGRR